MESAASEISFSLKSEQTYLKQPWVATNYGISIRKIEINEIEAIIGLLIFYF